MALHLGAAWATLLEAPGGRADAVLGYSFPRLASPQHHLLLSAWPAYCFPGRQMFGLEGGRGASCVWASPVWGSPHPKHSRLCPRPGAPPQPGGDPGFVGLETWTILNYFFKNIRSAFGNRALEGALKRMPH